MKSIVIILLFYFTIYVGISMAKILSVHCPLGCPENPSENDLVIRHIYMLSNNPKTKLADWVAYEVNIGNFGKTPGRNWKSDNLLNHTTNPLCQTSCRL